MACTVSDMHLDEGLTILQSLCQTRWAARSVNLRIVQQCLPALIKYLEMQTDADPAGLLVSITHFRFVFGLNFDNLETAVAAMRSDVSYQRMFNAAEQRRESLNIGAFGEEPID